MYLDAKLQFKKVINKKKIEYEQNRVATLSRVKDSKKFWEIINQVKVRNNVSDVLDLKTWHKYLLCSFPFQITESTEFLYQTNVNLDSVMTVKEIIDSLLKCKGAKAPGPNGIKGIFYKNLPPVWIAYLGIFFNRIMEGGKVPEEWSKLQMSMLYKKGDHIIFFGTHSK